MKEAFAEQRRIVWACPWDICNQDQAQACRAEMSDTRRTRGCGTYFPASTTSEQAKQMIRSKEPAELVRRGTKGDGTPWLGTWEEIANDYKQAADVEARLGDEARARIDELEQDAARYRRWASFWLGESGEDCLPEAVLRSETLEQLNKAMDGWMNSLPSRPAADRVPSLSTECTKPQSEPQSGVMADIGEKEE